MGTVTTVGTGSASAAPDGVRVEVTVRHRAASVAEALDGCASAVEVFGATARRFADAEDIATRGFQVERYADREGEAAGYQASHDLSVMCTGFDRAGELLTALGEEVGDRLRVHGVRPVITDPGPLQVIARERAFADARAKAEELAALAGQTVTGTERIAEGVDRTGGVAEVALASTAARTTFEPGSAEVSATVTVTWNTVPTAST